MGDMTLTAAQRQTLIDSALAVIRAWSRAENHEAQTLLFPLAKGARANLYDILAGSDDSILKAADAIIVTALLGEEQDRPHGPAGGWTWANGGEGALSGDGSAAVDLCLDWPALDPKVESYKRD